MIEKPVLNTLKDSESISGEIDDRGIITYVACNLRFHPAICFLKENLRPAEKKINEVNIYCGSYLPDWRPGRDFRTLYSADESKGGGVHLDLIHEIDYCIWIFGFPQKTSSVKTKNSTLAINAIDYAHYLFEYADFTASITLNYFRKDSKRQIEILFEDGTWTVDLIKSTIVDDNQKIIFESELRMKNTYKMQLEYFIKQVNNKRQPMNDFKEALNVLEIALS